ncbi:uncharacterized protein SAPINGB_P005894 [Magnusiomyces paraingens]|uniref:Ribosome biogenesis protein ERB1 n=1 Tax=Magnusiomyces paraingens TaxID=2606893 RepID=A0A5E8C2C1_9ASCO|nr:uncharacterized protein SAPINGB_P005894 [Saprochaete ingens]VVT57837.1 unnamed protein product [Saprochaete ingens]
MVKKTVKAKATPKKDTTATAKNTSTSERVTRSMKSSQTKRKVEEVEEEDEEEEERALGRTSTRDTDELSIPSLVFDEDESEDEEEETAIDAPPVDDSDDNSDAELEKLIREEEGDIEDSDEEEEEEEEDSDAHAFSDDEEEQDYTPDPRRLKAMGIEVRDPEANGKYSRFKDRDNVTWTTGADKKPRPLLPEIVPVYDSDDTDNEDVNTIGNVPLSAYDTMPHIGYDIDGKRIMRPANKSAIDSLLESIDLPTGWTGLIDKDTGGSLNLSKEELEIIKRIQRGENPDDSVNPYEDYVDWFTHEKTITPLEARPEPKRRFVPSKHEAKRVMKIVRAIREGKLVLKKAPKFGEEANEDEDFQAYDIWAENENEQVRVREDHLPAPKLPPPTNDESYNPPEEYLPDDEERAEWERTAPEDRERNFLPKKYDSLRKVAGYGNAVRERYERNLDLYLAPRARRPKVDIDPESLIPELPSPKDLRPFPIKCSIIYAGHKGRVRAVSIDPTGQYLATGGDDGTVRIWEVMTGRELWRVNVVKNDNHDDEEENNDEEESSDEEKDRSQDDHVDAVQWNPNAESGILAVAAGESIYLLVPPLFDIEKENKGRELIEAGWGYATGGHLRKTKEEKFNAEGEDGEEDGDAEYVKKKEVAKWSKAGAKLVDNGVGAIVRCKKPVKKLSWHRRGDYFVTVSPKAQNLAVLVHQLSKHSSQSPFKRSKGIVQDAMFHPTKPQLFVATQRYIRVYDLQAQILTKKLLPGVTWLSSIDVHPLGDNVITSSYDKRVTWHDLDLSARPYKTLRYHEKAIRQVAFHKGGLPLFCSASDDGSINVYHGTVYDDLMKNPLLVPLKILKGHEVKSSLGVLSVVWHPKEAWLFSVGADGTARMWTT